MDKNNWWVVKTKSRAEKKVAQLLNESGYEACCPTYTTIRQWSDRKKKVELPLISCTVFVRETKDSPHDLYQFSQITSVMKEHGKLAIVRDVELQNLLILCGQWEEDLITHENYSNYQPGDMVQVVSGKFQGMEGEMMQSHGKHKLYISIKSLQMAFSVVIPKSQLKLLSKKKNASSNDLDKAL